MSRGRLTHCRADGEGRWRRAKQTDSSNGGFVLFACAGLPGGPAPLGEHGRQHLAYLLKDDNPAVWRRCQDEDESAAADAEKCLCLKKDHSISCAGSPAGQAGSSAKTAFNGKHYRLIEGVRIIYLCGPSGSVSAILAALCSSEGPDLEK